MNNDFLKGRMRKPIANKIPMDSPRPGSPREATAQAGADALKEAYQSGWDVGYAKGQDDSTPDKDMLSHHEILGLLESDDYITKHGKTIAKALREEWGIE